MAGDIMSDGSVHWFGPTWQANINRDCDETPTPVGVLCLQCATPIEADDRGVTMLSAAGFARAYWCDDGRVAVHIDCHVRSIIKDFPPPERKVTQECVCRGCGHRVSRHPAVDDLTCLDCTCRGFF